MVRPINSHSFEALIEKNEAYVEGFKKNPLMLLIQSDVMSEPARREKLLDCIQVFSNYFQKIVMLRRVFSERSPFLEIAQEHLSEEFNHDLFLMKDRKNKAPLWDPSLDSGASWFLWKMFTLSDIEKTFLVHLILEESANIFFIEANRAMNMHNETDYFSKHSELDQQHVAMGASLLNELSLGSISHLFELQERGWDVLNMICKRIAELVSC